MAKKGRAIKVDLSDVSSGGVIPEDDYLVKVDEVTQEEGQESEQPYLAWKLKVSKGEHKGFTLYHNTSLQPQALFNLRQTLEALGQEIEDSGPMDLELDGLEGETMGVSVEHEEYKGKTKSRVVSCFPESELGKEEEEEEDEKPKKKKKDEDDEEEEETPKKKKKKDEDDEEEEEEKPRKKKKKSAISVGDSVTFEDDESDEQTGKVIRINEDDDTAVVKVKKEEWEVSIDELTVV